MFCTLIKYLSRLFCIENRQRVEAFLEIDFLNQTKIKATNIMARINNLQTVTVELKPLNRKGGAAAVQAGSVAWASSDESVATITADPENELKATVTPVGLGVTQITVSADADLSEEGVREINGSAALEVVAAEAESFELDFGEPQEQA
jgi:hypothetical protein